MCDVALDPYTSHGHDGLIKSNEIINDETIEGIRRTDVPAFSVQYHPVASPGPHDSRYLFDQFIELIKSNRKN